MLKELEAERALKEYARGADIRAILPDKDEQGRQQLVPLGLILDDLFEGIRLIGEFEEPDLENERSGELPIRGLAKDIMELIEDELKEEQEPMVVFDGPIEMPEGENTQTEDGSTQTEGESVHTEVESAQTEDESAQNPEEKPRKARKGKPKNAKIDDEEMLKLLAAGKSQREIAKHFGVAISTVAGWNKRHKMDEEHIPCKDCRYRTTNTDHGTCNYIGITGHMRGCPAVNCKRYEKGEPEPEKGEDMYVGEEEFPEG